jgi:multicomponent K+:H+ antiporter subunit E
MTVLQRLLPQPFVTLAIIGLSMFLASEPSLGNLLLAIVLGVVIPQFTQHFWPDGPKTFRVGAALRLFLVVLADIVVANLTVARIVLSPLGGIRPAFVDVPLDTADPFVVTILGSIITLTPGTVTIDLDREARVLHIHALDVVDEAALVATIKARYEAPLKEIFGC